MQDLIIELQQKREQLNQAISDLEKWGRLKAQTECEYRQELQKEILMQREQGTPVTIISDICRGKSEIAEYKRKRDIAETMHETVQQKIYALKLEIGIIERQIQAERQGL